MFSHKRTCPNCGATNNGMQAHCLLCKTELPAVDRSGITPISELAAGRAAPLSPGEQTMRASSAGVTQRRTAVGPASAPVPGPLEPASSAPVEHAPDFAGAVSVPSALPLSELLHRGPLASIGAGCVSILFLMGCAGCSLLALRLLSSIR